MKTRLFTVLFVLATTGLQTQTIYYVAPNGTNTGASWSAVGNLETIVKAAKAGDEIRALSGTYKPSAPLNVPEQVKLVGSFTGTDIVRDIVGNPSIIDARGSYGPVVRLGKLGVLDGFVVQNGARNGQAQNGGGVYAYDSTVIKNCKIINNLAYNGGGVYGEGRSISIVNCVIQDNKVNNLGSNMYGYCFNIVSVPCGDGEGGGGEDSCQRSVITLHPSSDRYEEDDPCQRSVITLHPSPDRYEEEDPCQRSVITLHPSPNRYEEEDPCQRSVITLHPSPDRYEEEDPCQRSVITLHPSSDRVVE